MQKPHKGFAVFMLSAFVTLLALGSVFAVFFLYAKTKQTTVEKEDVPYISDYSPKKQENMNVLLIGCEEIQMSPSFFVLFSYDSSNGTIYITPLPTNTIVYVGMREDTLGGHYNYEGMHGGVGAAKNLLLTDIDRYVRIDKSGMSSLIDFLGGIAYELTENIPLTNETLVKGKQLLDGRRASALLFQQNEEKLEDIHIQAKLFKALIDQRFDQTLAHKYSNFISAFFANVETNINQYDFALRKKGMINYMHSDKLITRALLLEGDSQTDEQFIPTEKSLSDIMECLHNIAKED